MAKTIKENEITENDVLNDPSCSYWLKEQIVKSSNLDPVDMLNDIDILVHILNSRINK